MKADKFLEEYKEFNDLFSVVEEPEYSKIKLMSGELSIEDYAYWMDRFLEYGGKLEELKITSKS